MVEEGKEIPLQQVKKVQRYYSRSRYFTWNIFITADYMQPQAIGVCRSIQREKFVG